MFLTRKHLSRRTLLKGVGASLGLPLLDAMIPAGTASAQTAAAPPPRLGFVSFPHRALQHEWQPTQLRRDSHCPLLVQPLEPLPMETNPRKDFYTMFGQGDNERERTAILKSTDSLLDYVKESTASLNRKLDAADRTRVSEYLDSVREIEIRVQKLEASMASL